MSEEFGSDFITITDDDGNQYELEHLDTLEIDGVFIWPFSRRMWTRMTRDTYHHNEAGDGERRELSGRAGDEELDFAYQRSWNGCSKMRTRQNKSVDPAYI
jgi:hypothetical protein